MALLIQLTAIQTLQSYVAYSIYTYEPVGANIPALGSNFNVLNDNLLSAATQLQNKYNTPLFRALVSTQWALASVTAKYVGTTQAERDALPGNFASGAGAVVNGTSVAEILPRTVAASIRFNRPDASVRHGYKRPFGFTEDKQVDGAWLAQARTDLGTWAASLLTLDKVGTYGSAADSCRYVCLRKEINGQELPTWRYLPCTSTFVQARPTTQVTRRYF